MTTRTRSASRKTPLALALRCMAITITALFLTSTMPAWSAKLVDAPPPPPMPENLPDDDAVPPKPAMHETFSLGRLLYENHCTDCHESGIHIRARHAVKSLAELRNQVMRWSDYSRLQWNQEEIEAVVRYLNDTYYQY